MEDRRSEIVAAEEELIEKAKKDGVETVWDRKAKMKVQCGFGLAGVCCRNCAMGPCRVSPVPGKGVSRGICGATADVIVARNFARMCAAGAAAHSDHGRSICLYLENASRDGQINIRDEKKLAAVAKRFGIETEGRDIYDVAHDLAAATLNEYGKPHGNLTLPTALPKKRREVWDRLGVTPRAIDKDIVSIMHSTHIGCSGDAENILKMSMRASLGDGWGGSYIATELSDILFTTPSEVETTANLGVLEENSVNVILHGHEPVLSEAVVAAAEDPELIALAKAQGADGINLCGMCCTGNEIALRHGIKMAGNFLQQELAVVTGAVEALIVDVQCIMPSLAKLSQSYHTKFITTSPKAKITDSLYIEFDEDNAYECAKQILKEAILNYKNRDREKVLIPHEKCDAVVGFSTEAIVDTLDKVVNSNIDQLQTVKPLADVILSGVIRGAAAFVGCNNPKVEHDGPIVKMIKYLIAHDVIVVVTGCAAHAAAKAGLLLKEAKEIAGPGLKKVCDLLDIPPVLHQGSCVDISRNLQLVGELANYLKLDISDLPVVGAAPEWMSEKAVAIGMYVVGSGIDAWLGVVPPVTGGPFVADYLLNKMEDDYGSKFFVEPDPDKAAEQMLQRIESKRKKLNI
ncbi:MULTISPECIES: anaerobic carbon-monoxide dehydrogenase catalytic subunit [Clostridium]|uniref:Carbon monoxide dehydrogenase n=1 Tax=Clostridium ragsdalei P11 TaxID=1353534 RepID=A0A1A6B273_9CLOT|nr:MULTISPECIES: anaerobic carbon-monoxide dehydrogenase catalytic subunit [Clostridium]OBR96434.1 carbon monoxide dehydrogenase 1 [Clostridium ragsdalei P11]QXE19244.1 carbon-monoxide dehydrogenase catalytic subunit [Clostridium sp. 001]